MHVYILQFKILFCLTEILPFDPNPSSYVTPSTVMSYPTFSASLHLANSSVSLHFSCLQTIEKPQHSSSLFSKYIVRTIQENRKLYYTTDRKRSVTQQGWSVATYQFVLPISKSYPSSYFPKCNFAGRDSVFTDCSQGRKY